jgi:hypothetical protein
MILLKKNIFHFMIIFQLPCYPPVLLFGCIALCPDPDLEHHKQKLHARLKSKKAADIGKRYFLENNSPLKETIGIFKIAL